MNLFSIKLASKILHQGGVIAYPTEAVFGLGCDPLNNEAIKKILHIKHRPASKGLILIASDFSQLHPFLAPIDINVFEKIMKSWPGPTTWLLPANPRAPKLLRGKHLLQAVRVSDHPIVKQLCDCYGGAIVSTSANISNRPAARNALSVRKIFNTQLDFIVNEKTGGLENPSEIKNAFTGKIIRPK